MRDPFRARHATPRRKVTRRVILGAVAAITAGAAVMAVGGPAQAATVHAVPVIRYTPVQPLCHASQAGTVAVIAGDGWHMFPARCDANGEIFTWDALPMPPGSAAGNAATCAALSAFNHAGVPSARQLGTLAWDGLSVTSNNRRDIGTLIRRIILGRPFQRADWRMVLDCNPDW